MSSRSPDVMKRQGFSVGRIPDGELVGVTPNSASENPSYTKSLSFQRRCHELTLTRHNEHQM